MPAREPWSQAIEVNWQPCLDYFERHVQLLRHLKDQRILRQFRVSTDEFEARLTDGRTLTVGVAGLKVIEPGGAFSDPGGLKLLAGVLDSLRPKVTAARTWMVFVGALDWPLEKAAAFELAARAFCGNLAAEMGMSDISVLADGTADDIDMTYQIEFGVVDATEIPMRASRRYGNRINAPTSPELPPGREYPNLAIFADSIWAKTTPPVGVDDLADWVLKMSGQATDRAAELLISMEGRLSKAFEFYHQRVEAKEE
jgi:hypothetical protein